VELHIVLACSWLGRLRVILTVTTQDIIVPRAWDLTLKKYKVFRLLYRFFRGTDGRILGGSHFYWLVRWFFIGEPKVHF